MKRPRFPVVAEARQIYNPMFPELLNHASGIGKGQIGFGAPGILFPGTSRLVNPPASVNITLEKKSFFFMNVSVPLPPGTVTVFVPSLRLMPAIITGSVFINGKLVSFSACALFSTACERLMCIALSDHCENPVVECSRTKTDIHRIILFIFFIYPSGTAEGAIKPYLFSHEILYALFTIPANVLKVPGKDVTAMVTSILFGNCIINVCKPASPISVV